MSRLRGMAMLSLAVFFPTLARATTVVPLSDEALVDGASIIVRGKVAGKLPNLTERAVTDWLISVDRVLKGAVPDGAIVLRVPGGETPSGEILKIYGAPEFREGERVLLFLREPRESGVYEVLHFMQGAFHELQGERRTIALQDFSGVDVRPKRSGHLTRPARLRDFSEFERWIEDRSDGVERPASYLFEPSAEDLQSVSEGFTLFVSGGLNVRWFEFDSGVSVAWRNSGSQPGLSGGGVTELQRAMAAWNNESTTPVRYAHAGTSSSTTGLTSRDSQNVVLIGDPTGEIEGFDCASGGTLARGGWWGLSKGTFDGRQFVRIVEADVVINDGIECLFPSTSNRSKYMERLFGHELGHTLGIRHSSENVNEPNSTLKNALMYYTLSRFDTRGARLNSDDVKALQTLYRKGGAGGGGTPPPSPSGCPSGTPPETLCLLKGRFHVTGTWQNQFDGSSGTAKPIVNSDLSGFFYFSSPSNVELIIKILDFQTQIKVFYSQLTNLKFTLSVRDTATGKTKTYSNTPGECGAIDDNFGVGALTAQTSALLDSTTAAATGTCKADATTLCTLDNRFSTTVTWRNQFNGNSGTGAAKKLSDLTGAFSFDSPANLEILIKTLEFPDRILVIYGSLSNFEYTIRVTDTTTGAVKQYHNPAGKFCGGLDENAF
jgi:hypothetical protein